MDWSRYHLQNRSVEKSQNIQEIVKGAVVYMDYQKLFGCIKCNNINSEGDCTRKDSFDGNNPSTSPFLRCPFFRFNYDLMIPHNGDFYILNSNGVLFTPIYWDIDMSNYLQLRKCEILTANKCNHLVLDMRYPHLMIKDREYIIGNGSIVHIEKTSIIH